MMMRAEADLPTELKERLRFETPLADISVHFVNLPAGRIDREIKKVSPDKEKDSAESLYTTLVKGVVQVG
jgi:hypothetical protein